MAEQGLKPRQTGSTVQHLTLGWTLSPIIHQLSALRPSTWPQFLPSVKWVTAACRAPVRHVHQVQSAVPSSKQAHLVSRTSGPRGGSEGSRWLSRSVPVTCFWLGGPAQTPQPGPARGGGLGADVWLSSPVWPADPAPSTGWSVRCGLRSSSLLRAVRGPGKDRRGRRPRGTTKTAAGLPLRQPVGVCACLQVLACVCLRVKETQSPGWDTGLTTPLNRTATPLAASGSPVPSTCVMQGPL